MCELDARTRILCVAGVGVGGLFLDQPLALGIWAAVPTVAALSRMAAAVRPAFALVVLSLVWSATLSQGLFYGDVPRHPAMSLGPLTLWKEGLGWGLVQSLRIVASASAAAWLVSATSPDALLRGLLGLRVPAGAAVMAVAALRTLPTVLSEGKSALRARRQRRPREGLVGLYWVLVPLAARTLRRATTLAEALDARGFDPLVTKLDPPQALPRLDRGLLGVGMLGVAVLAFAEFLWLLRQWGLLWDPRLEVFYVAATRWW